MDENSSIDWEALRRTRDKLAAQIGDHPEISLIDIGLDPMSQEQPPAVVLRVHVRKQWTQQEVPIPQQVDGTRIVVVPGDYQLE